MILEENFQNFTYKWGFVRLPTNRLEIELQIYRFSRAFSSQEGALGLLKTQYYLKKQIFHIIWGFHFAHRLKTSKFSCFPITKFPWISNLFLNCLSRAFHHHNFSSNLSMSQKSIKTYILFELKSLHNILCTSEKRITKGMSDIRTMLTNCITLKTLWCSHMRKSNWTVSRFHLFLFLNNTKNAKYSRGFFPLVCLMCFKFFSFWAMYKW